MRHGRAEADDVAVGVGNGAFVLPPFRVLRRVHLHAGGAPLRCQVVGIVDEEVRRAGAAVVAGHDTEVELDAVAGGEAVAAS